MARCGCATACSCLVQAGTNVTVIGNGSQANPYVLSISDEGVRDTIAAALVAGSGISIVVDDAADTITISATSSGYTDEQARDAIAASLVAGTGMSIFVDDLNNSITLTNTVSGYTDEQARDAIGAALVAGTGMTIVVNDAGDTITLNAQEPAVVVVPKETTTAAGLPPFGDRVVGDRHYNETDSKEYALTGARGGSYFDSFNRVGALNGSTTESGGGVWTAGPSTFTNDGADCDGTYSYSLATLALGSGTAACSVSSSLTAMGGGHSTAGTGIIARASGTDPRATGYMLYISPSTGEWHFVRAGAFISSGSQASASAPHTITLEVAGTSVKGYVDGVLVVNYTDATPLAGTGCGLALYDAGGTFHEVSVDDLGTLAWTSTDEYVAAHTHPGTGYTDEQVRDVVGAALVAGSGISIAVNDVAETITVSTTGEGAVQSTVGSGLPTLGGRAEGDHHYDLDTGRDYVFTGALGVNGEDLFERADSTNFGSVAGLAYTNDRFSLVSGKARGVSGYSRLTVDAGFSDISATTHVENGMGGPLISGGATSTNGYYALYRPSDGVWVLYRSGAGFNGAAVPSGNAGAGAKDVTLSVEAGLVELTIGGVVVHSVQDGTPLAGTHVGLMSDPASGVTTDFPFWNFFVQGTAKWVFTDPQYFQGIVSGAIAVANHVLKPGIRMPAPTTMRQFVVRFDAPLAGGATTVVARRFNNGVDTGDSISVTVADGQTVGSTTGAVATAQGDIWKFDVTVAGGSPTDMLLSLDAWG